jgi:hypothetical protein
MALNTTTLTSAVAVADRQIVVSSATGMAANNLVRVDDEWMLVAKNYVSGTTIPVIRGQQGSVTSAHVTTANVINGLSSDFANPIPGTFVTSQNFGPGVPIQSITATSTLVLPTAGAIHRVILNGTSVITLTVPVPTKDMDGTLLFIGSNGAAAHVVTFTSTLNNAGAGYTSFTNNASGTMLLMVMAINGFWTVPTFPAWTGTVTKVVGGIA